MVPTPDPVAVASLPTIQQIIIYAVIGGLTLAGWLVTHNTNKKSPPKGEGPDYAVTAATFADMKPIRELAAQVERLADAAETGVRTLDRIKDIMKEEAIEAEIDRRVQERLKRATDV